MTLNVARCDPTCNAEGVLGWLRRNLGDHTAMGGVLGVFEEFYNPAAARADEERQAQHERVQPAPSPGDRLLNEGRLVLPAKPEPGHGDEPLPGAPVA
ncbi:MAG: hypothetical protein ACTHK1_03130 [Actinomycetales bacterium]